VYLLSMTIVTMANFVTDSFQFSNHFTVYRPITRHVKYRRAYGHILLKLFNVCNEALEESTDTCTFFKLFHCVGIRRAYGHIPNCFAG
jgi:hypothetical protein